MNNPEAALVRLARLPAPFGIGMTVPCRGSARPPHSLWRWSLFYVFFLLAICAFVGFGIQSLRKSGHGMVYAAVLCLIWLTAAAWWDGAL